MGRVHRNIQLVLEFLKAPLLILNFCYYTLITSLITLCVIMLSMPMILLFSLSEISHMICGNNQNWILNLNLTYITLHIATGNRQKHLLRCCSCQLGLLGCLYSRKLEPWFVLWSFFLLRLFFISINLPYGLEWKTVIMSRLVLLVAIRIY